MFDRSRKEGLMQIAECDEDLARGDRHIATLRERLKILVNLQRDHLERRDAMLSRLRPR
jgi:hypothetical protein